MGDILIISIYNGNSNNDVNIMMLIMKLIIIIRIKSIVIKKIKAAIII